MGKKRPRQQSASLRPLSFERPAASVAGMRPRWKLSRSAAQATGGPANYSGPAREIGQPYRPHDSGPWSRRAGTHAGGRRGPARQLSMWFSGRIDQSGPAGKCTGRQCEHERACDVLQSIGARLHPIRRPTGGRPISCKLTGARSRPLSACRSRARENRRLRQPGRSGRIVRNSRN